MFNRRRTTLVNLLWLFVANAMFAGGEDFTLPIEQPQQLQETTSFSSMQEVDTKVESYIEKRGMIRRGATQKLFVPKGQWVIGGQVGWNQWDNENLHYLLLKDINFKLYTFSASPYVGYFFAKNMAVGGRFSYKRVSLNLGELGLNLGDGLNLGLNDYQYLQHNYKGTAFLRSYIPIGESKIFGLFGELQLNYTFSEGKNCVGYGDALTGVYENVHSVGFAFGGGMAVFLTDFAAAEVMLNMGGYDFKWGTQDINSIEQGYLNSSGANFRLDLFSLKFGVTFYL